VRYLWGGCAQTSEHGQSRNLLALITMAYPKQKIEGLTQGPPVPTWGSNLFLHHRSLCRLGILVWLVGGGVQHTQTIFQLTVSRETLPYIDTYHTLATLVR
jgi:hypothetical protein